MKKLTFKVTSKNDCSVVSLIKAINKISCRIYLDLENGFVTVENVNDTMIDNVIELVDNHYMISGVDIDNILEETAEKQNLAIVEEASVEDEKESETSETVTKKHSLVLEPQSEDDLIIKKVEFQNEYVENLINKFLRTASWAMFKKNVHEKEIGSFIYSAIDEISMKYNNKECIEFSVGDIVSCNYGTHLPGEINGGYVHAIVCDISSSNMVYLVPITKIQNDINSRSYLIFKAPEDVAYKSDYYSGGTALLDKAKYVRVERINDVVGRTTPAFFEEVLYQLPSAFDFTALLTETVENKEDFPFEMNENFYEVDETANSEATVASEPTDVSVDSKTSTDKVGTEEAALIEVIGTAFNHLDKSKSASEQVENFMNEIGMPTSAELVMQSFVVACIIKKINYENVILELHNMNPNIKEDVIKAILQENFKSWLKNYPELAEKCPKISLMSVLKVFAKRIAQDNNC